MAQQNFDHSEFLNFRYYLGTHSCPEGTVRVQNYYGITGTPTLWFNGTHKIVGAGSDATTGEAYSDIIMGRYFDAAPIRIDVDSFTPATGATSATVTMYSTTTTLTDATFLFSLIEEDVDTSPPTYDYTHITRAMYTETFSLTGEGNTAVFNHTFTIDPSWDTTKLRMIAFVQLDATKEIIQASSSDPHPDFKIRAMAPFSRTTIGPSTGMFETEALTIINTGLTDTFTIEMVIDTAPAGWTAAFKDSTNTTHTDPLDFGLTADDSTTFKAVVTPTSPGYMRFRLVITSTNLSKPLEIPFVYITEDVEVLVIDDDGGESFEDYFTNALDATGKTYGVWNRGSDALIPEAQNFDVLVWFTGLAFPTLDTDDKAFLGEYLDNGKALFITGQDIGWDLNSANPDPVWYRTYLHSSWIADDTNRYVLTGLAGDPVADGFSLTIQGGSGANNQAYPDRIAAYGDDSTEIFLYEPEGWCGATRSLDSDTGARVVYLGFGYEAIDTAQDRQDLMDAVISWIGPDIFSDGFESGDTSAWE